jgi:hypothetical protein
MRLDTWQRQIGPINLLKGLIFGCLLILLLGGTTPAGAAETSPSPPPPGTQKGGDQAAAAPQVELPNTTGPIITDLATTQAYKTWTLQVTPTLNLTGGVFNSRWQRQSVGANQTNLTREFNARGDYKSLLVPVQLFYGLTPRMDVSVATSFMQNWASNVAPSGRAANFGSLGDTSVQLRYMFLNGGPTATTVTGYFSVLFPTGHASPLEPKLPGIDQTGGGAFSFTWGINVFKYLPEFPVLLYANLWYTNLADGRVNGARVIYPDQITLNLAMEIPFKKTPDNRWAFLLEVLSLWDAGRMVGPRANQAPLALVSILPALEFLPCKWFTLAAGVQVPLIGRNTTYNCAPTLALYFNF